MKKILFLILVIIISSNCFSQKLDSLQFKKYYKISLAGKPQKIELIQFKDYSYKGYIITELDYSNRKIRFTKNKTLSSIKDFLFKATNILRKKEVEKEVIDTSYIELGLAKKLFLKLRNNNIEKIKNCKVENNCKMFLDSDYTSFKIKNDNDYKSFGFQELYPSENGKYLEAAPQNRIEAQRILTILNNELDFEKQFYDTIERLPEGSYSYHSGNATISMNSEN
ncbi:hypothetical protein [Winogradskyella bathintestinalis]|uniref:DUF4907 domain-containing protein n=1 Tax=Winogradskyella bathintestinalis TaxID=3035208 RepID=A0ABT7ZZ45_9FLAO|nr:hypothetical protein [Winogradskyella bathintestinalis]MDN3494249.1 hypothetical protein [Winogradskyella bathintestinalis]